MMAINKLKLQKKLEETRWEWDSLFPEKVNDSIEDELAKIAEVIEPMLDTFFKEIDVFGFPEAVSLSEDGYALCVAFDDKSADIIINGSLLWQGCSLSEAIKKVHNFGIMV